MSVNKNLRIDEPEYVEAFQEENQLPSFQAAVNQIVREHRTKRFTLNIEATLDLLAAYFKGVEFRDSIEK